MNGAGVVAVVRVSGLKLTDALGGDARGVPTGQRGSRNGRGRPGERATSPDVQRLELAGDREDRSIRFASPAPYGDADTGQGPLCRSATRRSHETSSDAAGTAATGLQMEAGGLALRRTIGNRDCVNGRRSHARRLIVHRTIDWDSLIMSVVCELSDSPLLLLAPMRLRGKC